MSFSRLRFPRWGLRPVLVFVSTWTACALSSLAISYGQLNPKVERELLEAIPKAQVYRQDGVSQMMYGTPMSTGETPLESAWNYLNQWPGLFAHEPGEFVPQANALGDVLQGVMFDRNKGQHKFYTFRFNQH
ncbi:MAG TPA: hypothetical protein PKD54_08530, partial [Pirellulaceae bacterium]|nr:hypothetical protein [Pirellulaceae bacterium]